MAVLPDARHDEPVVLAAYRILRTYWILILPAVLLLLRFFYYKYASPLRRYPGPFLASGSRAWKVLSTYSGHTETDHIRLHEKYGPVVRIAPNELGFSSPKAARSVLAAGSGFHKTQFYAVFPPPENPDIFTETREDVHAVKKRYASGPYSMATMHTMADVIESVERDLTQRLDKICQDVDKRESCDLGNWLHYFAFDVLGEIAFSRRFGFLEAGFDVENAIKTIDDMQWYDGLVGQIPEWDWVFRRNPLWKLVPGGGEGPKRFLITRMALEAIEERRKVGGGKERKDLLQRLIEAHDKAPDVFRDGDVFAVAHGAIFAGSDSTASTMQSFSYHVLHDPAIYTKLKKELDDATQSAQLSGMPQWNEVQALPYFQACLKEAMRVRPAVGLNITRLVPPAGAEIEGNSLPGGTQVALNGWVLHRDQEIFGADAHLFRPERWLEGDAKTMERYMFQVSLHQTHLVFALVLIIGWFGGGAHLCIGKNLALLEMNKTLPLLFRDYEFQLLRPNEELKYHSTFFVVQEGLEVRISKRGKSTS